MSFDLGKLPIARNKRIHFIGIGGVGMGGIAEVLLNQGFKVQGSDISLNPVCQRLKELGATIFCSHNKSNLIDADVVVTSSAINEKNPELIAAKNKRIPIVPRAEMLGELMRFRYGIAVTGTHGKTTTTSLIASILGDGGLDPTFVIGGRLTSIGSNARFGSGPYFVAEADESDASFLFLKPMMAVVTNIDADHMGTYQGNFAILKNTFLKFLHHLPFYGLAVLCDDDPIVSELLSQIARPTLTYSFNNGSDIYASDFRQDMAKSHFIANIQSHDKKLPVSLNLPGRHNVLNACAAITVALELGVSESSIINALDEFQGIGRRFQIYGDFATSMGQVMLIDDYGHHPTEVQVTLTAVRTAWPNRRLVMAYQPHRYSRTRDLFEDFSKILSEVDVLLLLDVYAAGEAHISGADSRSLCRSIRQRGVIDPIFVEDVSMLPNTLKNILQDGDIVLTQGAGSIGNVAAKMAAENMNLLQLLSKET